MRALAPAAAPALRPHRRSGAPSRCAADGPGLGPSDPTTTAWQPPVSSEDGNMALVTGGLRRTPLSGGVQSATTKHDLPSPAVAVRNLMEQARYAHLCTVMSRMHHRRAGYPFGSLVDYATDADGLPLLALSPLAIHTRNVLAEPRVSMVVQMPGWSGLANARVTLFGDLHQLAPGSAEAAAAAGALRRKHAPGAAPGAALLGNFLYFRMAQLTDIYFVGGFGTVQWVDCGEYTAAAPDPIVCLAPDNSGPEAVLAALNGAFAHRLPVLLAESGAPGRGVATPPDEANLVSIDRGGVDVRTRRGGVWAVQRLRFPGPVDTPGQAQAALRDMLAAAP